MATETKRPKQLNDSQSSTYDDCFEAAIAVAREAGQLIRDAFNKEKRIEHKSSIADLVTETDKKVEDMIISTIRKQFPTHSFIGEESVAAGHHCQLTDNPTWIIDPVDGTTNFVHRFPYVAVCIGFVVDKRIEFGVVYNAILDQMFTGRLGQGAFLNGERLGVSGQDNLQCALFITEVGSCRKADSVSNVLTNIESIVSTPAHGFRALGSAALDMCSVASGSADAYYEYGIHCWDMAASAIVVTEAGGVVLDPTGEAFNMMSRRVLCASSQSLAQQISQKLQHLNLPHD